METVEVSSTTEHGAETENVPEVEKPVGDFGAEFDVSDILANYFSKKFHDGTSEGEEEVLSSKKPETEAPRDGRKTSKKRKKDKKERKERKHRSRSSSNEESSKGHDRRSRKSKRHRHHESGKHRSHRSSSKDRHGDRKRSRSRSPRETRRRSTSGSPHDRRRFNKSELFEVARRNVKLMLVNGTLPKGFVIDAEKMGFNKDEMTDSIERYTQMCRKIRDEDENEPSSSQVNHPFMVKDKPIRMNIANSVSLPTKTSKEKILSAQFPVSSGSSHRELEWQPVEPEPPKKRTKKPLEIHEDAVPPVSEVAESEPQPEARPVQDKLEQEIRSLSVSQLLNRVQEVARRLESNPFDIEAKQTKQYCEAVLKDMSMNSPELRSITSCISANMNFMCTNEPRLTARPRKNQLRETKALDSGIGMTLLQKMGWTPGTALGKNQEGVLEPLLPQIKFDRRGLSAQKEVFRKPPPAVTSAAAAAPAHPPPPTLSTANRSAPETATLQKIIESAFGGKHPVTLILEICAAKKLKQPLFFDLPPVGEPHDRTFLCRVEFNGRSFIPTQRSLTKKLAKAQAALLALADIGEYDPSKHQTGPS